MSKIDKQLQAATKRGNRAAISPWALNKKGPSRTILFGASGSGKTYWLVKALTSMPCFDFVIWLAPSSSLAQIQNGALKVLKQKYKKFVKFIPVDDTVPKAELEDTIDFCVNCKYETAIVSDDLMMLGKKDKAWLDKLFISGRHSNISPFELTQSLYNGGKTRRTNSTAFVLFRSGQRGEIANFSKEICSNKEKAQLFTKAYNMITNRPHGCLIVDFNCDSTQDHPQRCRDSRLDGGMISQLWEL